MGNSVSTGRNTTLKQKVNAGDANTTITLDGIPWAETSGAVEVSTGNNKEWWSFTGQSGNTLTGVVTGFDQDATSMSDFTEDNKNSHAVGTQVRLVNHSIDINNKFAKDSNNTVIGTNTHTGIENFDGELNMPIYADATARDAAITSPREGSKVKLTTEGVVTTFIGGGWVNEGTSTTPNASTSVAGKVEIATTAESQAGTDTGGTGALLTVLPSDIASNIQDSKFIAATSSAGTDAYIISLTPAITAYVNGQSFILDADVTNTGACTVNINGLGAKSIKLPSGSDPADSDIIVGNNHITYDGTNFVLTSPVANTSIASIDAPVNNFNSARTSMTDIFGRTDTTGTGSVLDGSFSLNLDSGATANSWARTECRISAQSGGFDISGLNPVWFANIELTAITDQDAFFGIDIGNSPAALNGVYTTDHVAFLVEDGILWASVADGAIQSREDISSGITLTDDNEYYFTRVGATYEFYVNGVLESTRTTNLPNSGLVTSQIWVRNSAAAGKKATFNNHTISFDK